MSSPVTLSIPGHTELHLRTSSGDVRVSAEERPDVLIEEGAPREERIERDATGRISLPSANVGSSKLEVRVPLGTDLVVGTMSGKVELEGALGQVRVTTVSGHVTVERAETLDVRSVSGHIEIERCDGACLMHTKSGHAVCKSSGDARVSTISGEIRVDEASGKVRAQTVSGKVGVGLVSAHDVAVQTMSGSVRVEVPKGVRPHARLKSLSGHPRIDCEQGSDCEIAVRSLSGKIEILPS
jgi:DUF4097 and DUF4098 domain-containing protein YvlB